MINQIKDFIKNEEGAETLEYVAVVAIIVGLAVTAYGNGLPAVITTAFGAISTAVG